MSFEKKEVKQKRYQYIGGSDYPIILGLSPFKDRQTLAGEKAGLIENEFTGNIYTEFGNFAEPIIRDYINDKYGFGFVEDKFFKYIEEDVQLRGHVDGYDKEKNVILEIKTSSGGNIKSYQAQLEFYQHLVPGSTGIIVVVKRTKEMLELFEQEDYITLKDLILEDLENENFNRYDFEEVDEDKSLEIEKRCRDFMDLVNLMKFTGDVNSTTLPAKYEKMVNDLGTKFLEFSALEAEIKRKREQIYHVMDELGIKTMKNDYVVISRHDPTQPTIKENIVVNGGLEQEKIEELIGEGVLKRELKKTSGKKGFITIRVKK